MIKVLHISKCYFPETFGGVECVIRNLIKTASNRAIPHSLIVAANETSCEPIEKGYIYRFQKTIEVASCPMSLLMLFKVKRLFDQADIIHMHYPWPFADLLLLLFARKKKIVVTHHGDIIQQKLTKLLYLPLRNLFFKLPKYFVVSSPNVKQNSKDLDLIDKAKIKVIPIGIPVDKCLKKQAKSSNNRSLLFVGRLVKSKGVSNLISAVEGLDCTLNIVGSGSEKNSLMKQARGNSKVIFHGECFGETLQQLYQEAGIFILPSLYESYGIVLVEAARYNCALISTALGTGTTYINQHKKTGLVVQPNDIKELRQAIFELTEDKEKCFQYGQAACMRYRQEFTLNKMAERYQALYQDVMR